ncbi:MAG: Gfo/Idh/MocA family oxidoreductase [Candidatus Rokubacteria bacterium]|nr:Gfo/Idh/MocA family oxidoreductase [Candidatus Rokubacteria bacterium]
MQRSILLLGAGSIGKRHLRNLLELGFSPEQISVVEPREDRRRGVVGLGVPLANVFSDRDAALGHRSYDGAIVATPTALHYEDALAVAKAHVHLMIEKPLGVDLDGYDQLKTEVDRRGLFAFVAYCYRFHAGAQKMCSLLCDGLIGEPYYARGEMCSYLPAWHPYEDYREFYMAKTALGGGTLLDQSHLFDLTRMFLGEIRGLCGISARHSHLEIETDDFGELVLEMKSGIHVSLHMDLFSQPRREYYHVMGESGTLQWDIYSNSVTYLVQDGVREVFDCGKDKNAMYVEELRYFLRGIEADGPIEGLGLLDGKAAMDVVVAVRESQGRRYVSL